MPALTATRKTSDTTSLRLPVFQSPIPEKDENAGEIIFTDMPAPFRMLQRENRVTSQEQSLFNSGHAFVFSIRFPDEDCWRYMAPDGKFWRNGADSTVFAQSFFTTGMDECLRYGKQWSKYHEWAIRRPEIREDGIWLVAVKTGFGAMPPVKQKLTPPVLPEFPKQPSEDEFCEGETFPLPKFKEEHTHQDYEDNVTLFTEVKKLCESVIRTSHKDHSWLNIPCPKCKVWSTPCVSNHSLISNPHPERLLELFISKLSPIQQQAAYCELVRQKFVTQECPNPDPRLLTAQQVGAIKSNEHRADMPGFYISGVFKGLDFNFTLEWPTANFELELEHLAKWIALKRKNIRPFGVLRKVGLSMSPGVGLSDGMLDEGSEVRIRSILSKGRFPELDCTETSIDFS